MPIELDKLRPMLEKLGVLEVRAKLAQGIFGEQKQGYVEEWLRQKDQESEDSLKREEIDIARNAASSARDAADAARDAADETREANRLASEVNRLASESNRLAKQA